MNEISRIVINDNFGCYFVGPKIEVNTLKDVKSGDVTNITYPQAVELKSVLKDLLEAENIFTGVLGNKKALYKILKNTENNDKLKNQKVVKMLGVGNSAICFETDDGKVLKITDGNHFPMNRAVQPFDVLIYSKIKSKSVHFYFEEKLNQYNMPDGFVQMLKDEIKAKGYRTYDLYDTDLHQIGISKQGKLYLLDPECAKYKTIFHAIWDNLKRLVKR